MVSDSFLHEMNEMLDNVRLEKHSIAAPNAYIRAWSQVFDWKSAKIPLLFSLDRRSFFSFQENKFNTITYPKSERRVYLLSDWEVANRNGFMVRGELVEQEDVVIAKEDVAFYLSGYQILNFIRFEKVENEEDWLAFER